MRITLGNLRWSLSFAFIILAACGDGSSDHSSTGSATDQTPAGTGAFAAATYSISQSAGSITVTAVRTGASSSPLSIAYATSDASAAAGTDYSAASGTLNWDTGDMAPKTIKVTIDSTHLFTGNKSFNVGLSEVSTGGALGSPSTAAVTIVGGESQSNTGTLALSSASYSVSQSTGSATISVQRSGGSSGAASVDYATSDGTAAAGDYTAASGTLTWLDGDSSPKTFNVPISSATPFSGSKNFSVALSMASGSTLGSPATATVTITGSTQPSAGTIALSSTTYAVTQGTAAVNIMVSRSGGSAGAVGVAYATSNGTASSGSDYTASTGTLSWADGDTTPKSFTVAISNATAFSGTKTFGVTLSAPSGGSVLGSPATATVTITGSTQPSAGTIALSSTTYAVTQGTAAVTLLVSRSGGSAGAIGVAYATANGTAASGSDYTATGGTLSWAAGDTAQKSFTVAISNATAFSGTKTFGVTLSAATGGSKIGSPSSAVVTITGNKPASAGTIALSASTYSVIQSAGSVTVSASRGNGSNGAVSVGYSTANGTASAGSNYTAVSGTLSWASGETGAKTVSVPVSTAGFSGTKNFSVKLTPGSGGAALGTPASAMVTLTGTESQSGLVVKASGNHLVDGNGNTVQLRGVNISGFEFWSIGGYDAATMLSTQTGSAAPWAAIKSWGANAVRFPLNETSWNAGNSASATCTDLGKTYHPDPNGDYQTAVTAAVKAASAAGLYVILDLQWTAPNNYCAKALNPIADLTNGTAFWKSVAGAFKGSPNVVFDLFNEPFPFPYGDWTVNGQDMWAFWKNGGTLSQYVSSNGNPSVSYQAAGMQQLLNAVRSTGATNLVIVGAMNYSGDMSGWLTYQPYDSAGQMAVSWHAYPANSNGQNDTLPVAPTWGAVQMTEYAPAILAAGIPIVIGEFGDQMTGTAPFDALLLPWADTKGVSYLGWTWDTWDADGIYNPVLILDSSGTPSNGFGAYVKSHYLCRAAGTTSCQ